LLRFYFFSVIASPPPELYTLSLHDALPICPLLGAAIMVPMSETLDATVGDRLPGIQGVVYGAALVLVMLFAPEGIYWRLHALRRSEEHTSELQSPCNLVCRLLLEKKKKKKQ